MILESLELRNFRSHRSTKLRFGEGITVIVGDNGSGKTSILEAVNFALFKETPNRVRLEELVRRGGEKEGMQASLVFRANGRRFRVVRGAAEGKSTAKLYDADENILLSTGEKNRQTTREIEGRVHVDAKLFANAMYIRQGQIDALLTADARERKELIGKLIGTQELEKAYDHMWSIVKEYEARVEGYRDVPAEIENVKEEIKAVAETVAALKKETAGIEEKLALKNAEKEKVEHELEVLERAVRIEGDLRVKENEATTLRGKLREIESSERVAHETSRAREEYEGLKVEIKKLEGKRSMLGEGRRNIARLNRELETRLRKVEDLKTELREGFRKYSSFFNKKIESLEDLEREKFLELERLETALRKTETMVQKLSTKINELQGQNTEVEKALAELQGAGENCPVCSQPLTREHRARVIQEYLGKIQKNKAEMEEAEKRLERWMEEKRGHEDKLRETREVNLEVIKRTIGDIDTINAEVLRGKDELRRSQKLIESLQGTEEALMEKEALRESLRASYEQHLVAVNFLSKNAPKRDVMQERISTLELEISALKKEREGMGVAPDHKRLEKVRLEIKGLYDLITGLARRESAMKAEAKEKERVIGNLTERREELERRKREGEKLGEFVVLLKKIRSLFHKDNLQRELRARSKPLIEKYTREEFDKFHLPYSDISLSEDFDVTVYGPEGEVRMDMLSGGERIAAALALRIGIAEALSGSTMELLMLDEPTIHLDATRRRELVEIIKKLATIPQTIVVTHDKEFEGAADKLLLVEKAAGVSKVMES